MLSLQRQGPGTEAPPARRTLRRGSRGDDVTEVQGKLNRVDPVTEPLVLDGIFGPLTKAAVIRFQETHDLVPDGVVGPLTHAALDTAAQLAPPLRPQIQLGDTGPDVGIAQQKLNSSGAATPRLPIDAIYGATTVTAVMNFQAMFMPGTVPTGVIDRVTWAHARVRRPRRRRRERGRRAGRAARRHDRRLVGRRARRPARRSIASSGRAA